MPVAWATLKRNWLVMQRAYPWTYFIGTLAPGVFTVVLALLSYEAIGGGRVSDWFRGASGTPDYLGYVTVGAAALMFTTRMVLWVAKAQITEQREGTLESQLLTPARRLPYLLGVSLQAFLTSLLELTCLFGTALLLGVRLPAPDPVTLAAGVLAALVAVVGLSIPVSAIMIAAGEAHITQNTLFCLIGLVCGFTFPPALLPAPLTWLGELLPATSALRVLRAASLHAAPLGEVAADLLLCLGLGVAYAAVGLLFLPHAERRAVIRGASA
ncbi:ABC transporter permease [Catellatospora bangladeshensis]|uniref:ABC transporter n=1 Tax=Catellatospora bangladeshensis TaxID=310355 RepID=A0A8J3JP36_9ACTN|nr:ABC transporter permease [Catellatospora bangladeshensis]GIF85964.1 ABC transporter [Catellatospora bangladeshensis]